MIYRGNIGERKVGEVEKNMAGRRGEGFEREGNHSLEKGRNKGATKLSKVLSFKNCRYLICF